MSETTSGSRQAIYDEDERDDRYEDERERDDERDAAPPPPATKKKPGKKAAKPKNDPPVGGAVDGTAPTSEAFAEEARQVRVTRLELPDGHRVRAEDLPLYKGSEWINSHDLKYIEQHCEREWGGGTWQVEYWLGHGEQRRFTGNKHTISIAGDPRPFRAPPPGPTIQDFGPGYPGSYPGGPGGYQHPYGFPPPPPAPPPFGYGFGQAPPPPGYGYPQYGVPPAGSFPGAYGGFSAPPSTSTKTAEEELAELRERQREEAREARFMQLVESRLPKGPAVDPMATYLQAVQEQAKADRERADRERADRVAREEKEEQRRREREEKEEQRRREERTAEETRRREDLKEARDREEKRLAAEQVRMDKEEQRRREEAKEHREFLDRMVSNAKKSDSNPVKDLREMLGLVKEVQSPAKPDEEKAGVAEGVVDTLRELAGAGRAFTEERLEAKKLEREEKTGGRTDLGDVKAEATAPGGQIEDKQKQKKAPQEKKPTEDQMAGMYAALIDLAVQRYKQKGDPATTCNAMATYAMAARDNGNVAAMPALLSLGAEMSEFSQTDVLQQLGVLQVVVTNGRLLGSLKEAQEIVKTGDGMAWLNTTLKCLRRATGGETEA